MAEVNGGLLMIRRALPDGYGNLALPGGFQARNETWQQTGVRKVYEETELVGRFS
jgi:ADP-ribose pyrophosphatase YjhB (NUDIX family)